MADAVPARAPPLLASLPDEIVFSEILVRLPPKSVQRCRAVCHAWRRTISTRDFLMAHHGRQPSLPVVCVYGKPDGCYRNIVALDHRAADAQLQTVGLDNDKCLWLEASCDGLVIYSMASPCSRRFSVYNPATRQHALLPQLSASRYFSVLGMYLNRPSGEYRLLLHSIDCYVYALGSDQPPRYIGGPETASTLRYSPPALARDSLHWCPLHHQSENILVTVFDITTESFRQMRVPVVTTKLSILEMDGTIGIYGYDDAIKVVDIWVLQNYEGEVWENKYRIKLPVTEIEGQVGRVLGSWHVNWHVSVVSADGDVLLLLCHGQWLFCMDIDGKLVDSFHRDGQKFYACRLRLKQTLVPHTFFTALEDCAVSSEGGTYLRCPHDLQYLESGQV